MYTMLCESGDWCLLPWFAIPGIMYYNIGIKKVWGFWPKIITPKPA